MTITACIMQPTFLPWLGYFDLLDQADVFILDDLAAVNPKSWQTRNRIRGRDGNVVWLSVPVHAKRGQRLRDVAVVFEHGGWRAKHWRSLEAAYGHAPHWESVADVLAVYGAEHWYLTAFTGGLIELLTARLGIATRIVYASDLDVTRTDRIGRLADMLHAVQATEMLDTAGARTVLGVDEIEGVPIWWHDYRHPVYAQGGQPFMPYLSIVDLLAWHGPDALGIIRSGRPSLVA